MAMTDENETDFAVIVYREEDRWEVDALPGAVTASLDAFVRALRQQPSIGGTIGFTGIGDDFFLAVRIFGDEGSLFLSDLTAAVDSDLDPYPEGAVAGIADRLGFGAAMERALDIALGPLPA